MTSKTPGIVIIGAGPTGLTMALELARRGVEFRIIEKVESLPQHSKALAVHGRTLECFYQMDVAHEILAKSQVVQLVNTYLDKELRVTLSLNQLQNAPFPYVAMIPQYVLENLLIQHLEKLGVKVEWGGELTTLRAHQEHVDLVLTKGSQKENVKASWVIGADGAHSQVRKELDEPFSGSRYPEQFLLADMKVSSKLNPNQGYMFLGKEFLTLLPAHQGLMRVVTTYPAEYSTPSEEHVQEIFKERFEQLAPVPVKIGKPQWTSLFNIHRRIVAKMRVGRVFLAGDAAHIHSPIGGQGMNTGIQDSFNLAWKLALYTQGKVRQEFLNSYHEERHPVAVGVLMGTNLAMKLMLMRGRVFRKVRNFIAPLILNLPYIQRRLQALVSETSIRYRTSPIVYQQESPKDWAMTWIKSKIRLRVQSGDRAKNAPLSTAGDYNRVSLFEILRRNSDHTLLLFLGDAPKDVKKYADQLKRLVDEAPDFMDGYFLVSEKYIDYNLLEEVKQEYYLDRNGLTHDSYDVIQPTVCLIRPDGYVAYLGPADDENSFKEYLKNHFMLPAKGINSSGSKTAAKRRAKVKA